MRALVQLCLLCATADAATTPPSIVYHTTLPHYVWPATRERRKFGIKSRSILWHTHTQAPSTESTRATRIRRIWDFTLQARYEIYREKMRYVNRFDWILLESMYYSVCDAMQCTVYKQHLNLQCKLRGCWITKKNRALYHDNIECTLPCQSHKELDDDRTQSCIVLYIVCGVIILFACYVRINLHVRDMCVCVEVPAKENPYECSLHERAQHASCNDNVTYQTSTQQAHTRCWIWWYIFIWHLSAVSTSCTTASFLPRATEQRAHFAAHTYSNTHKIRNIDVYCVVADVCVIITNSERGFMQRVARLLLDRRAIWSAVIYRQN